MKLMCLFVVSMVNFSCARSEERVSVLDERGKRTQKLQEEVSRLGIVAVVKQENLSEYDRGILIIIADLLQNQEAIQLLGERPIYEKKYIIMPGKFHPETER